MGESKPSIQKKLFCFTEEKPYTSVVAADVKRFHSRHYPFQGGQVLEKQGQIMSGVQGEEAQMLERIPSLLFLLAPREIMYLWIY